MTKLTPPIAEILCVKNVGAIVVCGFLKKFEQKWADLALCYLAGSIKNQQTTNFPTLLTHNISAISGVS